MNIIIILLFNSTGARELISAPSPFQGFSQPQGFYTCIHSNSLWNCSWFLKCEPLVSSEVVQIEWPIVAFLLFLSAHFFKLKVTPWLFVSFLLERTREVEFKLGGRMVRLVIFAYTLVVLLFSLREGVVAEDPYQYEDWTVSYISASPLEVKQKVSSSLDTKLHTQGSVWSAT